MKRNFLISLFEKAFKMMKDSVYFIVIDHMIQEQQRERYLKIKLRVPVIIPRLYCRSFGFQNVY